MKKAWSLIGVFLFFPFAAACAAEAEEYLVGPGQKYQAVSQVTDRLKPGDCVTVTADIADSIALTANGTETKPITLRGRMTVANGITVRPKVRSKGQRIIINCSGHFNVVEGLEVVGGGAIETTGLYHSCRNLTVRNCYFHHHARKGIDSAPDAGDITVDMCEFDSCGGAEKRHSVDIWALTAGATATVRNCHFHDAAGGNLLKSHASRNVIEYNWFENAYYACLQIVDNVSYIGSRDLSPDPDRYPMHSDIVGNVFSQGNSPGTRYCALQLGGEHATSPGTEGDFNLAHNLFLMSHTGGAGASPGVVLLVHGNVDKVLLYNNAFLGCGLRDFTVYERGTVWDTPRTRAFIERRGGGEPTFQGSGNWISEQAGGIPETLLKTLRGLNPKFVDLLNGDFHPRMDSPLVGAGFFPLPKGRIVALVPEYEPQRGIPADLKPRLRRKVTPPSIGPFEAPGR